MRQIYGEDLVLRGEYDQMSVQLDDFLNFGRVLSCYLWFLTEFTDFDGSVLVEDQLLCLLAVEVKVNVGLWTQDVVGSLALVEIKGKEMLINPKLALLIQLYQ